MTAEIHIQKNLLRLHVIHEKPFHAGGTCTPESINGLIVVPYHKKIVLWCGKQPDYFILNRGNILKFIHQYIAKLRLPR